MITSKCDVQVFPWITRKCSYFIHVIQISSGCAVVFLNSLWFIFLTQSNELCFIVVFVNFFCEGCYLFYLLLDILFSFCLFMKNCISLLLSFLFLCGFFCLLNEINDNSLQLFCYSCCFHCCVVFFFVHW